ncbi:phosphoenolpyruvate--protein phosphotransferase [Gloeocapsopsis dulcis]|uniref:Phosphocarrier protein HPr n=1 Tax=Gloeocapsopsis dulcis AAB1 = 1H9 TaxID=1433147 RepID=A0A6N8FYL5_9CHRO|nr:phosphoenolpyruvate--protein phosphotransferase [Gloeocapsopsis dulcis]MUL37854.1 phosphoenolpyruvate--protein phosphotransferase [Gloeocapsopsis dulcis AAB1 = 1H9]WNN89816.1 phosphoenolpyruvate--protein phosphotransferase [Gloeocapsopsis dulcis]
MVGIVLVSHSKQLAVGVQELAVQMVGDDVSLTVAAGIDDPDHPLGTDAMQVYQAIESVYSADGVVVLMDLGSALLSAEMALEFLSEEQRAKVHLCEAPFVEGAIAATISAASGNSITQVIAEAREALTAKATQLGIAVVTNNQQSQDTSPTAQIQLTVSNRLGLHARPAARFVTTAAKFQAQIQVRNITRNTNFVRADSINQVTTLGVRQGHEIVIAATGIDAEAALAELQGLVANNFGEDDSAIVPTEIDTGENSLAGELIGIPASSGVAIAPVFQYRPITVRVEEYIVEDTAIEWQRLQRAIQTATQDLQSLQTTQLGSEAEIFSAHLLVLQDPALLEPVHQRIFNHHQNAEFAWKSTIDELANNFYTLEDAYVQERANDITDVGQRVLRSLSGMTTSTIELTQPSILVATDLTPSDTAQLDTTKVLGICTTRGSATSHTAILARTLGIPAVVGVPAAILNLTNGTLLAIDGTSGKVWLDPDTNTVTTLQAKRHVILQAQQQAQVIAHQPAMTRDGKCMSIMANIGSVADVETAIKNGAEGVGLLRTEFLYLNRTSAPTEEEQLKVYQAIAQVLECRPFMIRTLDIGGDKPLPYVKLQPESNPFLGKRGIRFCLENQEIFKTQLRAILRASHGHQIKMMFPMIATVQEVQAAKAIFMEVQTELRQANIPFDATMQVGIMVEIPSAVAIADQLATEVDFFSIGTNDLTQYVMAADRTNSQVATLADALHPSVLRTIHQTVQAAHQAGIWVGLCGELAADPVATPILIGLGIDELSLNPQAIPMLKHVITELNVAEAEAIAQTALSLKSAQGVRTLVSARINP